jgi:hypothetical protein
MAFNIVSAVARYLTPEVVGKIATASGLNGSVAQGAVNAAVPAILSALTSVVDKPGGTRKLADAVAEQPADLLTSLASKLTGSAQMASQGSSLLSSLLGGSTSSVLAATVSKFLGIGEGPMQTVMGLLAPVIMGVVGGQQRAANLDANSLARLLTGQKDQIADAMPAGLSQALNKDGIGSTDDRPRVTQGQPSMRRMVDDTRSASWPYWALGALLLGGLLWSLLPSAHQAVDPVKTSQSTSEPSRLYLARAPDNWVSIGSAPNDYVSHDLYNKVDERIGTIKDILIGPDGKMAAAIISVGRYLGIGDKDVAVPFSALQLESRAGGRRIVMDATKEALQSASTFEGHQATKR